MQKGQTLIFLLIGILIVAGGAFLLGKSSNPKPSPNLVVTSQTPQPTSTPSQSPSSDETATWKTYTGRYIAFKYPNTWTPSENPLGQGAIKESLRLGIPNVQSDQDLGFSSLESDIGKPKDTVSEKDIRIGGKDGFKWIRKGAIYVSYDYYIKGDDPTLGLFGVHVTVGKEDSNLESQLDKLITTIQFK